MLSRREFLATAAATPLMAGAASSTTSLLFAPQTGLFERSVGCDVVAQMERSAALGFRAFCDPQWLQRSPDERRQIVMAAQRGGLTLGPVVGQSIDARGGADWGLDLDLDGILDQTEAARGVGGVRFAIGPTLLNHLPKRTVVEFGRRIAQFAATQDQTLLLDPWDDGRGGAAVFQRWGDLIQRIEHPRMQLVADGHQLEQAGVLLSDYVQRHRGVIGHVELPRLTPRNLPEIASALRALSQIGYRGVIGLRQGLIGPVAEAEMELVAFCRELDRAVWSEGVHPLESSL